MSQNKRSRKPTCKALECHSGDTVEKQKIYVWCTVELIKSDGTKDEYSVNSKYLETESGQPVSEEHLHINSKVIWKSKGKPFEVTILDTHRTKPITKKTKMTIVNSGSSCSEDESIKITKTTKKKTVHVDDTDAEIHLTSLYSDEENPLETPVPIAVTPKVQKKINDSSFAVPFTQRLSQSVTPTGTVTSTTKTIPERLSRIERKLDNMLTLLKNGGYSSCSSDGTKESEIKGKFITESGIDLLSIRGSDPSKYALQLMDVLFTEEELASSCYAASVRSKKPGLDPAKITLLEDCVKANFKFDDSTFQAHANVIRRKGTQKCIDKSRLIKKV